MTDTLTRAERSARMRLIRGRDTKPEISVRRIVSAAGYKYRLHAKKLPGRPDLVFAGKRKVIFVHGCFWHLHTGCKSNRPPKSRLDFWLPKLEANRRRDRVKLRELRKLCWKPLVVWECELHNERRIQKRILRFLGN